MAPENETLSGAKTDKIMVSKHALESVLTYLNTMQINGVVSKPVKDISSALGISSATVLRALRRLEEDHIVQIPERKSMTEPLVVKLLAIPAAGEANLVTGAPEDVLLLKKEAIDLLSEMEQLTTRFREFQQGTTKLVDKLQNRLSEWEEVRSHIVTAFDAGTHIQLHLKKDEEIPFIKYFIGTSPGTTS